MGLCRVAHRAEPGRRTAAKAVDHISRSTLFQGLKIEIVTFGADTADHRKGLEDASAQLKAAGYDAGTCIVKGRPDEVLGKLVKDEGFGMLVMGAYGHSRIRASSSDRPRPRWCALARCPCF